MSEQKSFKIKERKAENDAYQHFNVFPQCSENVFLLGLGAVSKT